MSTEDRQLLVVITCVFLLVAVSFFVLGYVWGRI